MGQPSMGVEVKFASLETGSRTYAKLGDQDFQS
jgi:hypothetical protein